MSVWQKKLKNIYFVKKHFKGFFLEAHGRRFKKKTLIYKNLHIIHCLNLFKILRYPSYVNGGLFGVFFL